MTQDQALVFCDAALSLGEGPTYDPLTDTAWWFDIIGKALHGKRLSDGTKTVIDLPHMSSVLAVIDESRHLIASEAGLFLRDTASGALTLHAAIETDRPGNRSNDGRVHQSGALWIGTMSKSGSEGAGAIYHVAGSTVTRIFDKVGIPNAICFSPDGSIGYFVDTIVNRLMRVALDPTTGLPSAAPEDITDDSIEDGGFDGAVCDSQGGIWNARWGAGSVDHYDGEGKLQARFTLPAKQTTCPAFIGRNADRIIVTSARDGLDAAALADQPKAGMTFEIPVSVKGRHEPFFKL